MSGYDLQDVHRPRTAHGWALNARDRLDSLPIKLVRVASTANVASMSGVQTIDGVTLALGDRVLLKDQSTASQNGIWKVKAGTWLRPTDAQNPDHLPRGSIVRATEGTVNGGTEWRHTTSGTITLDTTSLTFVQHNTLPWQVVVFPSLGYFSTTNGTVTVTQDSAALFGGYRRATTLVNDEMVWKVQLGAGTWTVTVVSTHAANAPILTATLDGTSIGTIDLYGAGTTKNSQDSLTGVSVATSGVYSFKLAALSKNASSSAYIAQVYAITFIRTA